MELKCFMKAKLEILPQYNELHELLSRIRPLTFADRLAKAAGLPENTLGKHYRWVDGKPDVRPCPVKHQAAVVRALVEVYGAVRVGGEVVTRI